MLGVLGEPNVTAAILAIVSVANLSQFAKDIHAHSTGRWKSRLAFITTLDADFGFGCAALFVLSRS